MATKDLVVRLLGDASNLNKALNGVGNDASRAGMKLTKTLTPAAAAVGAAMASMGSKWNDARDAIVVGTGASGKALQGLMNDAKKVASNVPNDFGQVGVAVAELNTRLGLTGPELQAVAKDALNLSRITGTDVASNIRTVSRVVRDWGIETSETSATMDLMFRASQLSGIGVERLGDKMVQFGVPLRQIGFSLEETVALLSGFEAQGVNTELVMGSLRIALGKMARAGEEPQEAFARLIETIKTTANEGEAVALAMELFGARAGSDMAGAIREGRFEIDELVASLAGSEGSIADAADATLRFSDRLGILRNKVIGVLGPFGEIGGVIGGAVASIGPLLFGFSQMIPLLGRIRLGMSRFAGALGVASVALIAYALHARRSAEQTKKMTEAIDDLARADVEGIARAAGQAIAQTMVTELVSAEEAFRRVAQESLAAAIAIRDNAETSEDLGAVLSQLGITLDDVNRIVDEEIAAQARSAQASQAAAAAVDEHTGALEGNTDATEDNTVSTGKNTDGTNKYEDAVRKAAGSVRDLWRAQNESLTPFQNALRASERLWEATVAYNTALEENGPQSAAAQQAAFDLAFAQSDLEGALLDVSEAGDGAVETFIDMAEKAGVSKEDIAALRETLQTTKGAADQLAGTYQVVVDVNVETALRRVQAVQAAINAVTSRSSMARVGAALSSFANPADRHTGGRVRPGQLVQPLSGELFVPDTPGRVVSREDTARLAAPELVGVGASAPTYNVTVNAGMGANGPDIGRVIVEKIREFERSNGTRWRS